MAGQTSYIYVQFPIHFLAHALRSLQMQSRNRFSYYEICPKNASRLFRPIHAPASIALNYDRQKNANAFTMNAHQVKRNKNLCDITEKTTQENSVRFSFSIQPDGQQREWKKKHTEDHINTPYKL